MTAQYQTWKFKHGTKDIELRRAFMGITLKFNEPIITEKAE